MNTAIQAAFDHALLARARYSDLTIGDTDDVLANKLTKWPDSLADYLGARYEVSQSSSGGNYGYNGFLFRGIATDNLNHYVFVNGGSIVPSANSLGELKETFLDWTANAELFMAGFNLQIAPMETFFDSILPTVGNNPLTVVGHSLGAPIASSLAVGFVYHTSKAKFKRPFFSGGHQK